MNEVSVTKIGLLTTNLRLSRVFSELLPFLHMKNSFSTGAMRSSLRNDIEHLHIVVSMAHTA